MPSIKSTGDAYTFNTMDVRPQDQPQSNNYKVFSMSANPAGFPIGLTWLNIDRCSNIRIDAFAELVAPDSVKIHLDSPADTVLYSAGCTWLTVYADDRDFQFGRFSTMDDHPPDKRQMQTKRKITFPKPFHGKPPKVIVWLNEFHMSNSDNWRCKVYVTDITSDSFVIHIDTWASTKLYSATASWIAYPSYRPNISSGSFNTMDVRPWYLPRMRNKGTATFHQTFESIPRVFAAVNWLDISNKTNLRLKVEMSDISTKGLNWHLDTWDSTILYSAGASYIAILD
jgi:H-type lectin domain